MFHRDLRDLASGASSSSHARLFLCLPFPRLPHGHCCSTHASLHFLEDAKLFGTPGPLHTLLSLGNVFLRPLDTDLSLSHPLGRAERSLHSEVSPGHLYKHTLSCFPGPLCHSLCICLCMSLLERALCLVKVGTLPLPLPGPHHTGRMNTGSCPPTTGLLQGVGTRQGCVSTMIGVLPGTVFRTWAEALPASPLSFHLHSPLGHKVALGGSSGTEFRRAMNQEVRPSARSGSQGEQWDPALQRVAGGLCLSPSGGGEQGEEPAAIGSFPQPQKVET